MGGVPYFGMEGGGAKFWQLWAPHRVAMGGGAEWGGVSWRRGLGGGGHLESLLMTRMSAAFSSFSRWLSAFRSCSAWGGQGGHRAG